MIESNKIYLWDAANTLFLERWQHPDYKSFDDYVASKFPDGKFNNLDYERVYEEAYQNEYFKICINDCLVELLSWTKNNYVVTSGTPEQNNIRRDIILTRDGVDISNYLLGVISSFDYHDGLTNNAKNEEFWLRLLKKKCQEGYNEIIYADDKLSGVDSFYKAAKQLNYSKLIVRGYHLKNDNIGFKNVDNYWEAGSLLDILTNEKKLN